MFLLSKFDFKINYKFYIKYVTSMKKLTHYIGFKLVMLGKRSSIVSIALFKFII